PVASALNAHSWFIREVPDVGRRTLGQEAEAVVVVAPFPELLARNSYPAVPKRISVQVVALSDAPVFPCNFNVVKSDTIDLPPAITSETQKPSLQVYQTGCFLSRSIKGRKERNPPPQQFLGFPVLAATYWPAVAPRYHRR